MTDVPDRREIHPVSYYSIMDHYRRFLKGRENDMGFLNPNVGSTDGNLTDMFPEGTPFTILAAEVVKTAAGGYGEGEMTIVTVHTDEGDKRLSVWGSYLAAQVKDAGPGDFPATVRIVRGPVDGYSQNPDTKRFEPVGGANA